MNRKGDERVLSFYWMIMFVIVAIGLVSGVVVFFSHPLDVRYAEGNILMDQVSDCFLDFGVLNQEAWNRINNSGFESCGLKLNEELYVEVEINGERLESNRVLGENMRAGCTAESERNRPLCVSRNISVLKENGFVEVKFFVGVGKVRQNAI